LVTGLDLVREQLRIAAGEPLGYAQADVDLRGCAIECRITAEDATRGFMPSLGHIDHVSEPNGPGVRVDSCLFAGWEVSPHYDSLLSKLIVSGADREQALARLRRALDEYQILGVKTTLPFHRKLIDDPRFIAGEIDTRFLDRSYDFEPESPPDSDKALLAAALFSYQRRNGGRTSSAATDGPVEKWRQAGREAAAQRTPGGGRWRRTF
jgi:acetyl/propionyl-CoA carboxylase alpha subunit